jgi:hypothetical protein
MSEERCNQITKSLTDLQQSYADDYERMNAIRNWVNANFPDFELYLEDVWNERTAGETHLEYILRSRVTLNETDIIAYDRYNNHQDEKGVWHLDSYQSTVVLIEDMQVLAKFLSCM